VIGTECPACGEAEHLAGRRDGDDIRLRCETCGETWIRRPVPTCARCSGTDMQAVPKAIVEKSRGTQLSVVGTRTVHLCSSCDADTLVIYHRNRPNPLMPDQLPTTEH
jgi:ribosomal protein S27AE